MIARVLVSAASWLGPAALALLHAGLVIGIFQGSPTAIATAAYLENWPIAELVSLVVTPYLALVMMREQDTPRWLRILWLPLTVLLVAGIGDSITLLQATWVYIVARLPTLWTEPPQTRLGVSAGCTRSFVAMLALLLLGTIFADRPTAWPIGTIVGRSLGAQHRYLANVMALGAAYFAATLAIDYLIARELARQTAEHG